jgi:uncharacterized protein (TIGR01777 family)
MEGHVVITGATGVIGSELAHQLIAEGEKVVVFSRSPESASSKVPGAAAYAAWNYNSTQGAWTEYISGAKAIVHLAGKPLLEGRWTEEHKVECYNSRVVGTKNLVTAIKAAEIKPGVFLSASAVGYYGAFESCNDTDDLDESAAAGDDFLAKICIDWEKAASNISDTVRLVLLRTGIVLSTRGGMLQQMLLPFNLFLGGPVGSGDQCIAWIHVDDEVAIIRKAMEDASYNGPINLVGPRSVSMRTFAETLGTVLSRPSLLQVPKFALQILMGEGAEYATKGQKVSPSFLHDHGYSFAHPSLQEALADLMEHNK